MMITLGNRFTVSTVTIASLTLMLALGACVHRPAGVTSNGPSTATLQQLEVRFDNDAETYVDVYLLGQLREWRLGRVAPGARVTLRIPQDAVGPNSGFVRLAVLANAQYSAQAARDPRTTSTIAQPASALLGQRWEFSQRQSATPEILGAPVNGNRPSLRP
jgi:hypothetical protein